MLPGCGVDESGFTTTSASKSLLVRKGAKKVSEVSSGAEHEQITVQVAGSAPGELLPPFILYKGNNLYRRWMEGGPAGAASAIQGG